MDTKTWHGWIVTENGHGMKDILWPEYVEDGVRKRGPQFTSPAEVIDWWDARVGAKVKLLNTPLGAYRVYTEEE